MSKGVLYIASGEAYIEEATVSAESLKRHNPSLPVTLYTNEDVDYEIFDDIVYVEKSLENWGDSILSDIHFPYDKNLYLDADTFILDDITELFKVLDTTNLCLAHDYSRGRYNSEMYNNIDCDIPSTFPEYNTGVMAYNKCQEIKNLFNFWNGKYFSYDHDRNQPAFRISLYESDTQFVTIPPEYNFRTDRIGYACGKIKILHKCSEDANRSELAHFAEVVNSGDGKRVITWGDYPCSVVPESSVSKQYKLKSLNHKGKKILENEGIVPLFQSVLKKFSPY